MLTRILAWWQVLTQIGQTSSLGKHSRILVRHRILEVLQEIGLFAYLEQPRTYTEILQQFGFVDSPFTRDVLTTLTNDGILTRNNGQYVRSTDVALVDWDQVAREIPPDILALEFVHDFASSVPRRMRGESALFSERLDRRHGALLKFDASLTSRIYGGLRMASHTWARPLLGDASGKTLLNVGCASGRETAHLWVLFGGKVRIVAVDPVPSFVEMAEQRFPQHLEELGRGRDLPPLTDENRPEFHVMSAHDLDFPDNSFDIIFHSQMLHWTPDVRLSIYEMSRVLKPGGVMYGTEYCRPIANDYMNLAFTVSEKVAGVVWLGDLRKWYGENQVTFENLTAGIHRGVKAG